MTEEQKKEMLNGIINNEEKWECRECNELDTRTDLNKHKFEWRPYKIGDEIHDDWEYRRADVWCVCKRLGSYKIQKPYIIDNWNVVFSGTKEECEAYLKEHTKKTWLETYLDEYCESNADRIHASFDIKYVCKKILEEMENRALSSVSATTLRNIFKDLGIEVNSED